MTGYSQELKFAGANLATHYNLSEQKEDLPKFCLGFATSIREIVERINPIKVIFPDSLFKLKFTKKTYHEFLFSSYLLKEYFRTGTSNVHHQGYNYHFKSSTVHHYNISTY
jgi:hypothetical protein